MAYEQGGQSIHSPLKHGPPDAWRRSLGYQFYACGCSHIPARVSLCSRVYNLVRVLKHDFFAATALYESQTKAKSQQPEYPRKIILKLSRRQHFLGLPLAWLGRIICSHELAILHRLRHLPGLPRVLSTYRDTGFIYKFIEADELCRNHNLPDDFFDKLFDLLQKIHAHNVVYLDMNKRSNILLGSDGLPYLIDFQISLHIGERFLLFRRLSAYLRNALKKADIYHLFKHKCKVCPHLLRPNEKVLARCVSRPIRLHRLVATPLRKLRRSLLRYMYAKGLLLVDDNPCYTHKGGFSQLSK